MAATPAQKIVQLQQFEADPDVSFIILATEVMLLPPFLRWVGDHWLDATGEYDLCLSQDETRFDFISRRPGRERWAYRYISVFWLTNRLGVTR